jgi:signal transduction histidine kinase
MNADGETAGTTIGRASLRANEVAVELNIARCRLFLSVFALIAVYVDPTPPTILPALHLRGGPFVIDPYALGVLASHLAMSAVVCATLLRRPAATPIVAAVTSWTDVIFAALIAACTEGASSPFYVFFVFAVTASGFRSGMRRTLVVIGASLAIYLGLIVLSSDEDAKNLYVMRPVYLAVIGYLIAHVGEQRVELANRLLRLERHAERTRIASALHDGSLQTLIGTSLRLESCRQLLREGHHDRALAELGMLECDVIREYEGMRGWVHELASVERPPHERTPSDPRVSIDVRFAATASVVDQVLQVLREAIANVTRHARADAAVISARERDGRVEVAVDDDGVGFPPGAARPWSIASRVEATGGRMWVERETRGAHVRIAVPHLGPPR